MSVQRDYTIDIAKGLAIFLVVFGHVIQYTMSPTGEEFYYHPFFEVIYSFHMPLFMFISGYLAMFSINKRTLKENLTVKLKRIGVPYFSWTIILVLIRLTLKAVIRSETYNVFALFKELISNLFIAPSIWFLYVLFVFYCLLYISVYLKTKIGTISFPIVFVLVLLIPWKLYFGIYYVQFFYLFFLAGYLMNYYNVIYKVKQLGKNKKISFSFLMISWYVILMTQWDKTDYIYINLMKMSSFSDFLDFSYRMTVGLSGIFVAILFSTFIKSFKWSDILKGIGSHTLEIYLIQNILVSTIYREIVQVLDLKVNTSSFYFIVSCVLIAVISIAACIFISNSIIKKYGILNSTFFGEDSNKRKNIS